MTTKRQIKCAVVVGRGDFSGYMAGTIGKDEPRIEFVEIARATEGDCISFTTGAQIHGAWFNWLFAGRPNLGAAVHAALIAHRYEAIYVTGEDVGLPLALLLRLRGWKGRLVCLAHRITRRRAKIFRLIGAGVFHRVITVSEAQASLMVALSGFPHERVRALYNWVDDRFFNPELVVRLDDVDFVACGAENRDYDVVKEAFFSLPNHVMRIFGHGFFGTGITSANDARGQLPNVVAMPRVSYDALRNYYGSAKAVIVPLNEVDYAAGVTGAIEAMACGCPVIATETVGIAEYMMQIDPRLRVPPGDADGMVRAIEAVNDSDAIVLSAWGRANREWIVAHCSLDNYVASICDEMLNVEGAN